METESTNESSKSAWVRIFESLAAILVLFGLCFFGYVYYAKQEKPKVEEVSKYETAISQYQSLQKYITINDSILLHLITENRDLRKQYDSVLALEKSSPKRLPIFKK